MPYLESGQERQGCIDSALPRLTLLRKTEAGIAARVGTSCLGFRARMRVRILSSCLQSAVS